MIKRYGTKEMDHIWSDQNKFETWKKVELAVAEAMSERSIIPKESYLNKFLLRVLIQSKKQRQLQILLLASSFVSVFVTFYL